MTPPRTYFGYTRVSTVKQGELGVSLEAQRDAISTYAQRGGLVIGRWFEERVTAAKQGRPAFGEMVRLLRQRKAAGVIVHKIDRSARNFHDWAVLGDLIDSGVDVRFAHDAVDLHTRGGRLAADMMAVVAADFIRNHRDEVNKGLRGRLNQGLYPFKAPVGYLDQGGGKPKIPDPKWAPLVRLAFTVYDQGEHTLRTLSAELAKQGLRTSGGAGYAIARLSKVLRNPFYAGIICIRRRGESYRGVHEPLVSMRLWERVQARLDGRISPRSRKHDFLFRRMLSCAHCKSCLIGERQKGRVYYRCHTQGCPTSTVREDCVEHEVAQVLQAVRLQKADADLFSRSLNELRGRWERQRKELEGVLRVRKQQIAEKLGRLTDAYVEQLIDRDTFSRRKEGLLQEERRLEEDGARLMERPAADRAKEFLELCQSAWNLYRSGDVALRRRLVRALTSNRTVSGRTPALALAQPFAAVADVNKMHDGGHCRHRSRTISRLLDSVCKSVDDATSGTNSLSELLGKLPTRVLPD